MIFGYIMQGFYWLLMAYNVIILIDVVLSWIPSLLQFKIPRLINTVASFVLDPFRGFTTFGGFDFSPVVALGLINAIANFCLGII